MKPIHDLPDMYINTRMAEKLFIAERIIASCLEDDIEETVFDVATRISVGISLDKIMSVRLKLENEISEAIEADS